MARYVDCDPPRPNGPSGRKALPLLEEISQCTTWAAGAMASMKKKKGEYFWRCKGAEKGCSRYWESEPCNSARILAHAAQCTNLPPDVRQRVNVHQGNMSISGQLEVEEQDLEEEGHEDSESEEELPSVASEQRSSVKSVATQSDSGMNQGTLTEPRSHQSLYEMAKTTGEIQKREDRAAQFQRLDRDIMHFFVVNGIPPTVVDTPEWKQVWKTALPLYEPESSTTIVDITIPREAGFVNSKVLEIVRKEDGLTLSFDGGTTRGTESVYTIHIITQDRRAFLWEGYEASAQSHTAMQLYKKLKEVRHQSLTLKHA